MNQGIMVPGSELFLLSFALLAFIVLVLASSYDARAIAGRNDFHALVRRLRQLKQPSLTVLVYADGAAETIEACLEAARKSHYYHYDVVVITNAPSSRIRQIFKIYQQRRHWPNLVLYQKRKTTTKLAALRQGYRRSQKGELVLVLDGNSLIAPSFLKEGAARFVANEKLEALQVRQDSTAAPEFSATVPQIWQSNYRLYRKSMSLLRWAQVRVGSSAVLYRASTFKKSLLLTCHYDASLVVTIPTSSRRSNNGTRLSGLVAGVVVALLAVFFMTYFIVIAARLENSSMLTLSWLVLSIWCIIAVWSDEAMSLAKKIRLIVVAPLVYFLTYVQLIIWVFRFMREFSHTPS